ncbi:hypothetical protein [Nocardia thraciensis]
MFRVDADSLEKYFGFDPGREVDLRQVDELIRAAGPTLERWSVNGTPSDKPGMAMNLIGYGRFEYTVQKSPERVIWPIIGLALQKNYLSLYLAAEVDGTPFAQIHAGNLGKVDVSTTGAIRFVGVDDLDITAKTISVQGVPLPLS